jgi:hypothetical protein
VVAYGTRTHEAIGLNPGKVIFFLSCSCHVAILHYTENYYTKCLYFLKIYIHTSLYGPIASGASVDPTSQVCLSATLVLPIVEKYVVPNGILTIPDFIHIHPAALWLNHADRQT